MSWLFGRPLARCAGFALGCLLAGSALAEDLNVEVDHALLLRLDTDADIVHIANPAIADVALESPRMIFVVGLSPGQTGIYILDRDGNEMLAGSVLVSASEDHEVTLNRNTTEFTYSCSPRCSEVDVVGQAPLAAVDTSTGDSSNSDSGGF